MATKKRITPFYNHVDGVPVPSFVTEATWRSALNYKPRDDDVFIVEYPKCGMHWVSAIAAAIYSRGAPFASAVDYYSFAPLFLSTGAEEALTMKRPGVFNVHLPFQRVPWSPRAKYIFVARNPKDCCVSLYHYTKMMSEYQFEDGEFEDLFELFVEGKAFFGDYFDMLLSWYEHRNDPNVLSIAYEQMKKDNKKAVLNIAELLGSQYKEALLKDEKMLDDVIHHSSFGYTKQMEAEFIKELVSLPEEALPDRPALHMRWRSLQLNAEEGERRSAAVYMRKVSICKTLRFSMAEVTGRTPKVPVCNHVDGHVVPSAVTEATYWSALNYAPLDDDVFAVAYPKSGTHWVCAIVGAIYNRGAPFANAVDYYNFGPFFQATGAEGARCMKRPGILNLYLPFHKTPWSPKAKYIFVARNPKDICVSLYHYTKKFTEYKFEDGEFEDIFELFMEGKTIAGDYFEILLSWYEKRNEPNVLFITYEQIKKDTKKAALEIAEFLDPQYKADLLEDEKMLADVIQHSSIGFMKQLEAEFIKELLSLPSESIPDSPALRMRLNTIRHNAQADDSGSTAAYMRKGVVGDWNNYFTPEQSKRMDEKFRQRTEGTELTHLWKDYM